MKKTNLQFKKTTFLIIILAISLNSVFAQTTTNPDSVCVGSTEYYSLHNTFAGSTFVWGLKNAGGTIILSSKTDSINVQWSNTAGSDTLWLVETNSGGCIGDTAKLTVIRFAKPNAEFTNNAICYEESLQVTFTGYAPYTLEYTLNGNPVTQTNITTNPFVINSQAGSYQLLKVTDKNCFSTTLSGTTVSVIATPLNTLQIIHK